jgi:formylglycine-generating enzyme required for sulfatase activity
MSKIFLVTHYWALLVSIAVLSACSAVHNDGEDRVKAVNSLGMTFVKIEPGSFIMGSPPGEAGRDADETQHRVTLTESFMMGTTHVTIAQWKAFVADSAYETDAQRQGWALAWTGEKWEKVAGVTWRNPGFAQEDNHPVVEVSWNDAVAFCAWLSHKENRHYRLPTEAEYEYCCRAGTQTVYFWGDTPDGGAGFANLADQTYRQKHPNYAGFSWSDGYEFTSPVAHFKPNPWGLYDMVGNAWDWCSDWYGKYPTGDVIDPTGPPAAEATIFKGSVTMTPGPQHVMRGASWHSSIAHPRSANRDHVPPDYRSCIKSFRVVMDMN